MQVSETPQSYLFKLSPLTGFLLSLPPNWFKGKVKNSSFLQRVLKYKAAGILKDMHQTVTAKTKEKDSEISKDCYMSRLVH